MAARAFMNLANAKGWTLNGLIPANHEDTYFDEALGESFISPP